MVGPPNAALDFLHRNAGGVMKQKHEQNQDTPKHEAPAPKKREHKPLKERAPKSVQPPQPPRRSHHASPAPNRRGR
jgi:hypothetical protein